MHSLREARHCVQLQQCDILETCIMPCILHVQVFVLLVRSVMLCNGSNAISSGARLFEQFEFTVILSSCKKKGSR